MRKDYLKAVTEGRRFGSGKLVVDNWDGLKDLWQGSPAVEALVNATGAIFDDDDADSDNNTNPTNIDVVDKSLYDANDSISGESVSKTPKSVDNKCLPEIGP